MYGDWKDQVNSTVRTFIVFILSAIIDAIYVLLAVLLNVAVDRLVGLANPVGLTYWAFIVTQILLGILSIYNVGIYVYSDMHIIFLRSKKMIASAQKKIEEEES